MRFFLVQLIYLITFVILQFSKSVAPLGILLFYYFIIFFWEVHILERALVLMYGERIYTFSMFSFASDFNSEPDRFSF